jgi:hypothetical protein
MFSSSYILFFMNCLSRENAASWVERQS